MTTTSAVLNATLAAPGSFGDVWAFWGVSDGGTNVAGWVSSNFVGTYTDVSSTNISCTVTGLLPDVTYYFTFLATNTQDRAWAKPSRMFKASFSPSVYSYKMKVTFSGYDKAETLTNFPALVTFSESLPGVLYRQFQPGATDLRFADESETTELNYEIDSWNTNGSSHVWVQVPELSSSSSIWAYWGYTNAVVAPSYTTNGATWSQGYAGVWHMGQTNALDSTVYASHGTAINNTNTIGAIGPAQGFDGNSAYIRVPVTPSSSLYVIGSNMSQSAWVNPVTDVANGTIASKPGAYYFQRHSDRKLAAYTYGTTPEGYHYSTEPVPFNAWTYVAISYDGVNQKFYINGVESGSIPKIKVLKPTNTTLPFQIGWDTAGGARYWNGVLDEIHVCNTSRTPNWVWAEWLNQASNSFFSTYAVMGGIRNVSASDITSTSAVLNATLYVTNTTLGVSVYWDTNNWGTNVTLWANTNHLGSWTNVAYTNVSCLVTGLASDVRYYFEFSATNEVSSFQAPDVLDFRALFSSSLLSTYPYRMQITFSGYTVTDEILTNFPALVVLNQGANGFLYNQLKPTGTDLRFMDEATNELSYEIESWNTNGNSYVWVQVPQLTNNCSIWAYWGNTNAPVPVYLTNGAAWNANFMGVWHLHANAQDSTANRHDGSVYGGSDSIPCAGLIGNAWKFDGINNAIRVDRMIQDDFTIAFWMKAGGSSIGNAVQSKWYSGTGLIDAFGGNVNSNQFGVAYRNNLAEFGTGNVDTNLNSGTTYVSDMNWRYVVATRVKSTGLKKIYVDGVDCGTQTGSVVTLNWSGVLAFGQIQTWSNYFNGYLDEVEISNIDRSSNWVWASYLNQFSNSMFNPAGSVEGGFLPSINNHNGASLVLMNSANLNGYLVSTGGAATAVSVYWGTTDGGTNKGDWVNREDFVVTGAGLLTTNVTGLVCAENYYYRFYASNTFGDCWAPSSESFSPSRYKLKVQFGGYDKDETLTNFPALVVFAEGSNSFSYSQCSSINGGDLRFVNSNETVALNHEIEKWDTNGNSYVWVQVPELISNGWVWAYWGGSDTNAPAYSTNGATWSQNYLAVWHFNSTNTSSKYPDSTSYRFDGLNAGCSSTQGQIGGAVDLGVVPQYVDIAGIASSAGSYTFHYWLNTMTQSGSARITDINGGTGTRIIIEMVSGGVHYYDYPTWRGNVGAYINNGAWRHVVFAFDGRPGVTNGHVYVDGVRVTVTNGLQYLAQSLAGSNAKIGCEQGTPSANHFDGAMDEFQISTVPRSSNWIWACFMNQGSNSVFNTTNLVESTTLPLVNNAGGATNVLLNSAWLNGYLVSTGGASTAVSLYWGGTDGGTNLLAWANVINFGTTDTGPLSTNVTGLLSGSTYYYRYYATNSLGESWAPYSTAFSPVNLYQMKIVFSGYDRPETLTNFPALVVLSEGVNGFSYSQCSSANGGDLRFTASNGVTLLNHEIEKWDVNGSSYVWVQVPELVDANTYIWAYWGGTDTNPPAYTMDGSTWDSNYRGVFHLHESDSMHYDSTSYNNIGKTNGIIAHDVQGQIDGADYFYGPDGDDYVEIYNSASLENVQENDYTLEAWFKPMSAPSGVDYNTLSYGILEKYGNHAGIRYNYNRNIQFEHWSAGSTTTSKSFTATSTYEPGVFYHAVGVLDRVAGVLTLYINGQRMGTTTFTPGMAAREYGTTTWKIGIAGPGWASYRYASDAVIDEVRISGSTRSSNWIWACYMNMASNSSFMTSSSFISNEGGATNITANSAEMRGYLYRDDGVTTYVWVYYGQTDGGSIATNWQFVDYRDVQTPGPLAASIGSLTADTTYYYRYFASNSVRSVWAAPSASFFTGQATIQATDDSASEMGPDTGTFTVYRPAAATNAAWIVNYLVEGTASNGVDYTALNGSVTIPAGQTNATITVTPIEDSSLESDETVVVTLTSGSYIIGPQSNAVVTIHDTLFNSWPYRLKINFPGYTGYQGFDGEILTNFPALVVLGTNITDFSYSTFTAPESGGDLRFGNSNGTIMLNYEIEQWNTGGNSYVWVQIPEIVDTNTWIWAYWGNKNETSAPAYTTNGSTWSEGYAGVWHMNNAAADSTINRNNGTLIGYAANSTGIIANGQEFFGDDRYEVMGNQPTLRITGNQTIEMWLKPTAFVTRQCPFAKAYGGEWCILLEYPSRQLGYLWGTTGINNTPHQTVWMNPGVLQSNVWDHAVIVRNLDAMNLQWFRNGETNYSVAANYAAATASTLHTLFGLGYAGYYRGVLDEVRISNVARSTNWVWATYMNQASNDVFNTYGDVTKLLKGTVIIVR
ncbi:MAG: DUF2341 domain-containing protein [Kiritimatiellae bacterium]|nr:DUF2341 domain-containing protein [Kiritimatiellia bacterium]